VANEINSVHAIRSMMVLGAQHYSAAMRGQLAALS